MYFIKLKLNNENFVRIIPEIFNTVSGASERAEEILSFEHEKSDSDVMAYIAETQYIRIEDGNLVYNTDENVKELHMENEMDMLVMEEACCY